LKGSCQKERGETLKALINSTVKKKYGNCSSEKGLSENRLQNFLKAKK